MGSQVNQGNAGLMRDMNASMGRGMMGGGMMGGGMMGGGGGGTAGAVTKKDMRLLTRTDFLLQFVWIPVKPESLPQTPEELKTKLEDEAKKLSEAEKAYATEPTSAKLEETIEAESLKKSKAFESALEKATGANAPGAPGTPGSVPAAGLPGVTAPAGGAAAPKAGGPAVK